MSISRAALLLLGATILSSSTAFTPISSSVSSWRNQPLQMISKNSDDQPLLTSRKPQKLKDGRGTFLGFRNAKDVMPQGKSSSSLGVGAALYPDGGLSPCVIRVLGVGGGGCNAVSGHESGTRTRRGFTNHVARIKTSIIIIRYYYATRSGSLSTSNNAQR